MSLRSFQKHDAAPAVYDVCAVGDAIVDVIAECDDAFLSRHEITKGAMTLIEEDRADFLYSVMGAGVETSGGSAANSVAGIAALGGAPCFIGKVRDDQLGAIFRHDLTASGVQFTTPPARSGAATARCLVFVTPDAQRSMNTFLGACGDLSKDDIEPRLVANADTTFLEGYLFDKPKAQEAFYVAAGIAREAGRRIALSLSDTFCVDRHHDALASFVESEVECLLANEFEMMALYRTPTVEEAIAAARAQCAIVVATRSEKGAIIATDDVATFVVEASPPAAVLDTTGAGDMFAAGFLFGLTHGAELPVCGRLGALAAAEVIGHYGPRPQSDLKALMRQHGLFGAWE